MTETSLADSTETGSEETWTAGVKGDTALLELDLDSLLKLPAGAEYRGRRGRAEVSVSRSASGGRKLMVRAVSDSVAMEHRRHWTSTRVSRQTEETRMQKAAMTSKADEKKKLWKLAALLAGILAALMAYKGLKG